MISRTLRNAALAILALAGGFVAAQPAAAADPVTPSCAWATQSRPPENNSLFPDTNATYWLMQYTVQDDLQIELKGNFTDARFLSLTTYDSERNLFESNGVSSTLADYQIAPDAGATNPWQAVSAPGGAFTVTLRQDVAAGQGNVLPLSPAGTASGTTGYVILRLYRSAGDPTATTLPSVTFRQGSAAVTVPTCEHTPAAVASATTPSPRVTAATGRTVEFSRAFASDLSGFPSGNNGYLQATLVPPVGDQVVVIRAKAPTFPAGPHPAPWPDATHQVRYWSMCSNLLTAPYPVVVNGSDMGCRADDETTLDADGYYTYVVGTEAQRARIEALPGVTFVPFSADSPRKVHVLLLRNMLGEGFAQSVQNVPDRTVASAQATMGEYYPDAAVCALASALTCVS